MLKLTITSFSVTEFEREVDSVTFPGKSGLFTVYPNHEPFISSLAEGKILIRFDGTTEEIPVKGGVVHTRGQETIVLV